MPKAASRPAPTTRWSGSPICRRGWRGSDDAARRVHHVPSPPRPLGRGRPARRGLQRPLLPLFRCGDRRILARHTLRLSQGVAAARHRRLRRQGERRVPRLGHLRGRARRRLSLRAPRPVLDALRPRHLARRRSPDLRRAPLRLRRPGDQTLDAASRLRPPGDRHVRANAAAMTGATVTLLAVDLGGRLAAVARLGPVAAAEALARQSGDELVKSLVAVLVGPTRRRPALGCGPPPCGCPPRPPRRRRRLGKCNCRRAAQGSRMRSWVPARAAPSASMRSKSSWWRRSSPAPASAASTGAVFPRSLNESCAPTSTAASSPAASPGCVVPTVVSRRLVAFSCPRCPENTTQPLATTLPASMLRCCRPLATNRCCSARAPSRPLGRLLIRENFVRQVVNHDGALKVCDRRICTVLLPYESSPTLGVHGFSFSSGVPEIDSADCVPVLREDIVLADEASYALIFRSSAQEDPSGLVPCDRLWQLDRVDDYCRFPRSFTARSSRHLTAPDVTVSRCGHCGGRS